MGIGLLKRLSWARWLALGSSLLGWLLGSVLLLLLIGYLLMVAPAWALFAALLGGGGIFTAVGMLVVFVLLLWVVGIVISYKLFWHLCSEQGCEEFGVPHGSAQTVVQSCGAWIGIFIVNGMVSGSGQSMYALMNAGGGDASQVAVPVESEEEMQARLEQEAYDERRERAEAMLREQAELEAAAADGAEDELEQEPEPEPDGSSAIEGSPVPVMESAPEESEEQKPPQILKCVDASGGTIFTQGYCPPGSKPVRTPAAR
jgi:hypothetical protein